MSIGTIDVSGLVSLPSEHGSETRNLTLLVSEGDFIFEILEATKPYWAPGEQVYIHYKVRNVGTVEVKAKIEVYDADTNEYLFTWWINPIPPGYAFDAPSATDYKLKMPDRDWTLRLVLTP